MMPVRVSKRASAPGSSWLPLFVLFPAKVPAGTSLDGASTRREYPAQAKRVLSASTKRPSGLPSPGAATVDKTASRAGGHARLAAGALIESSILLLPGVPPP
jgi:hypothetical protein